MKFWYDSCLTVRIFNLEFLIIQFGFVFSCLMVNSTEWRFLCLLLYLLERDEHFVPCDSASHGNIMRSEICHKDHLW